MKGWSQEEVAHRLDMSVSGYGSIERGEVDVSLSRLEDIAKTFETDLSELFNSNEKIFFVGNNNSNSQVSHISQFNPSSFQAIELKYENEKLALLLSQ
jgi:transcriptional regulator with XRE-family HTH domain